jgi:hypothetical protein
MLLFPITIPDTSNIPELLKSGGIDDHAASKGLTNTSVNIKKK